MENKRDFPQRFEFPHEGEAERFVEVEKLAVTHQHEVIFYTVEARHVQVGQGRLLPFRCARQR